jgi:hypothetical protein
MNEASASLDGELSFSICPVVLTSILPSISLYEYICINGSFRYLVRVAVAKFPDDTAEK